MPESPVTQALALTALEQHALLQSPSNRRKLFTSYLAMREKIAQDYLPAVSSAQPYINDHSRGHLERVLFHIESLLQRNFPQPRSVVGAIPDGSHITWPDVLILLNSLVWHDVGNIYGRQEHGERVRECLEKVSGLLYDEHLKDLVVQVAEAHSGEGKIGQSIPDSCAVGAFLGDDIHPQFLAAILRFADEIDEDYRRAAPHEWDQMLQVPEASRRYWYFSRANRSVSVKLRPEPRDLAYWVDIDSHIPRSEFDVQLPAGSDRVPALVEYFRRLLKIERERRYCSAYMRTAYYHPGVTGLHIRLNARERGQPTSAAQVYEFEISELSTPKRVLEDPRCETLAPYLVVALGG